MTELPSVSVQAERLVSLGVEVGAVPAGTGLLVPAAPASVLTPLLRRREKLGFVVVDMTDVDDFAPIEGVDVPAGAYLVADVQRGDELRNLSPDEALPLLRAAGRTPLTLVEGIAWLLQQPDVLERDHCFMTIGSRLRKANGRLDARTPAIWISNGTGRDGRERREAPKVGWCWAGNRHTWLGFASAAGRVCPSAGPGRCRHPGLGSRPWTIGPSSTALPWSPHWTGSGSNANWAGPTSPSSCTTSPPN